jgi:hypothetical protein
MDIRVFISSTFRDMKAEREHLIKVFFPQFVDTMVKPRGNSLTVVDLRWGITEERARAGDVLPICLSEIDHCRPFFLCHA